MLCFFKCKLEFHIESSGILVIQSGLYPVCIILSISDIKKGLFVFNNEEPLLDIVNVIGLVSLAEDSYGAHPGTWIHAEVMYQAKFRILALSRACLALKLFVDFVEHS